MSIPDHPHHFQPCPKCGHAGPWEGIYVSKQTETEHTSALHAIRSWPYRPDIITIENLNALDFQYREEPTTDAEDVEP